MITAKEAYEQTLDVRTSRIMDELAEVEKAIKAAIDNGCAQTRYFRHLLVETTDTLMKFGYSVKDYSNKKDGSSFIISWDLEG